MRLGCGLRLAIIFNAVNIIVNHISLLGLAGAPRDFSNEENALERGPYQFRGVSGTFSRPIPIPPDGSAGAISAQQ